jgi:hypothetical protein
MEYVLVLDASAPSAKLNSELGWFGGAEGDGPPTVLAITCTELDTSHGHLLRAKAKSGDAPRFWVPYSHVVGVLEGPDGLRTAMGFTPQ